MTTVTTRPPSIDSPTPSKRRLYGLMAEFETPGELMHAAEKVRDAGYRWWDCHTPFPVHGLDKAMGIKATTLPIFVFFAGLTGATAGLLLQTFTNATSLSLWLIVWVTGYPFMISGKPMFSLPAFIPVIFELTILFSAIATVSLMFAFNGLPRLHHPLFRKKRFRRATDDRFFIVIESKDPRFFRARTEEFMRSLNPTSLEAVED